MKVEVETISKETIKPSSPTPDNLKRQELSFLDQIAPPVLMPLVMFYRMDKASEHLTQNDKSVQLKKGLSQALTHFYPLAGRVKGNSHVDCNDEGVDYFEAKVNADLSDFLANPIPDEFVKFFPYALDDAKEMAMAIQINFFQCGGIAVGLSISHKLCDALSFAIFLNSWSAIARGDIDIPKPVFVNSDMFPPKDLSGLAPNTTGIFKETLVTKAFTFNMSKISDLRQKYAHTTSVEFPKPPTRIEALTALLGTRFISITQTANPSAARLFMMLHALNLRTRTDPPLSAHSFGNIMSVVITLADLEAGEKDCYGILKKTREEISKVDAEYVHELGHTMKHLNFYKELAMKYGRAEMVTMTFTSLCRFPLYDADFGWGKPIWVTPATWTFKNLVTFLDTEKGDGVIAWVTMKEDDMARFEADEELLSYASV